MDEQLKIIEKFHGHLGPYVVLGYKMGIIANKKLGIDPFCKNVIVLTGSTPPLSCLIDGIQISSGCTLGKGNIKVENKGIAKAIFSNKSGNQLYIKLKDEIRKDIEANATNNNLISYSENLYKIPNSKLFEIE